MAAPATTRSATTFHEGGCLCGAVRYRAGGPPTDVTWCHCSMCRRASGAPAVAWATFGAAAFAFTRGEPARYASSEMAERTFCGRCGTPLTFRYHARPGEIDVSAGSLDDPAAAAPTHHIFAADRVPWMPLDDRDRYEGWKDEG